MKKAITCMMCGLILAFLAASAAHAGADHEWLLLDENPDSYFSYDKAGASKQGEGIMRITARVLYTEEGKAEALQTLQPAKGYEKLSESHYLYDLDCKERKSKLLRVTHLGEGGTQIKSIDLADVTVWEDIPPAARLELIAELACTP